MPSETRTLEGTRGSLGEKEGTRYTTVTTNTILGENECHVNHYKATEKC